MLHGLKIFIIIVYDAVVSYFEPLIRTTREACAYCELPRSFQLIMAREIFTFIACTAVNGKRAFPLFHRGLDWSVLPFSWEFSLFHFHFMHNTYPAAALHIWWYATFRDHSCITGYTEPAENWKLALCYWL